jgi:hypothetical protein
MNRPETPIVETPRSTEAILASVMDGRSSAFHRKIGLHEIVATLQRQEEDSIAHLTKNLLAAKKAVEVMCKLPKQEVDASLLKKAGEEILRRLPPKKINRRASGELELAAAVTLARAAPRYDKDAPRMIAPLLTILETPKSLSKKGAIHFAIAAETLLRNSRYLGEDEQRAACVACWAMGNPQLAAINRVARISKMAGRIGDLSQESICELSPHLSKAVDQIEKRHLHMAYQFLTELREKYEISGYPQLIIDVVMPAEATWCNIKRPVIVSDSFRISGGDMLCEILEKSRIGKDPRTPNFDLA